jgi:hypothetical protein
MAATTALGGSSRGEYVVVREDGRPAARHSTWGGSSTPPSSVRGAHGTVRSPASIVIVNSDTGSGVGRHRETRAAPVVQREHVEYYEAEIARLRGEYGAALSQVNEERRSRLR